MLGDTKYGDSEFNKQYIRHGVRHQLLHAYRLVIPETDQTFVAPAPELFCKIIKEENLEEAYHENLKEIWDYAKMIIIVVVIVTLVNSVVLINAKIPSESMEKPL